MQFSLLMGTSLLTACSNPAMQTQPPAPVPSSSSSAPVSVQTAGIFTAVGTMGAARVYHTATLLGNGKVLIAGGWDGSQSLASAELYDPSTRTFAPTGSMITPRHSHTATLLADGRVLIAGGNGDFTSRSNGEPIYSAELYDPSTGAFIATGELDSAGGALSSGFPDDVSTLLPDGRVFLAASNNAEIYDPHSGTFSLTGPYLSSASRLPDTVTLLPTGKVLFTEWYGNTVGVELFDPQSGTFGSTAGPMTYKYAPDFGYTAASLADGRVFLLGSDDLADADVEVYDANPGIFTSIQSTTGSQEYAPATRLTDGTVLIAGGEMIGGSGSAGANLFVPATGTFEYAGAMTIGRGLHRATALPDDTVLITGGWSVWTWPNPQPTASAEIYKPK